jgi:16S rRNA (guanine527-N7)-methyltransferase
MLAFLKEGLLELGLDKGPVEGALPLLSRYIEEIELFNPAYGLVKVANRREFILRHILDSLAPLEAIKRFAGPAAAIADIGSGAGLPGIPLAIFMPDAQFCLVERSGRRAGFLRNALAVLGLPNVRLQEQEMEKLGLLAPHSFDVLVFRAFRPLEPAILKGLSRLLAPGGSLAAYKGRRKAVEEEMAAALASSEKGHCPPIASWEILPLSVPFLEEERHLLLVKFES